MIDCCGPAHTFGTTSACRLLSNFSFLKRTEVGIYQALGHGAAYAPTRIDLGGLLIRECQNHRPAGVAEPYREHRVVRDDNICCAPTFNMAPSVPACTPSQIGILIPAYFTGRRSNCTGDPS